MSNYFSRVLISDEEDEIVHERVQRRRSIPPCRGREAANQRGASQQVARTSRLTTEQRGQFIAEVRQEEQELLRNAIREGTGLEEAEGQIRELRQQERDVLRVDRNAELNQRAVPNAPVRGRVTVVRGTGRTLPGSHDMHRLQAIEQTRKYADAERQRNRRAAETTSQSQIRRQADTARHERTRAEESVAQTQARIQTEAVRQQQRRAQETADQYNARIQADTARHQQRRAEESTEQYHARIATEAARQQLRRAEESVEQYHARIATEAARQQLRRAEETTAQSLARIQTEAARVQERRLNQTPQQRAQANTARRLNTAGRQRRGNEGAALDGDGFTVPDVLDLGGMDVVCSKCGALFFEGESARKQDGSFNVCCGNGKVDLPLFDQFDDYLKDLYEGRHPLSQNFVENIREFNNAFAVASMNCKIKQPPGRGPQVFRVHGAVHHAIGTPIPAPGQTPTYGQIYLLDTSEAANVRMGHPSNKKCNQNLMGELGVWMATNYEYAESYEMVGKIYKEELEKARRLNKPMKDIRLLFHLDKNLDKRRFNFPISNEVAAVFVTDADGNIPDCSYSVYAKPPGGQRMLQTIYPASPGLNSMLYPLLFPKKIHDWTTNLQQQGGTRRVTLMDFASYLFSRRNVFNPIHLARKLFHQLAVDIFIRVESQRLYYIRTHQSELRTETRQHLADHVADGGEGVAGMRIILPASYTNSPRFMVQNYQDSMAIVTRFGKPDYFVTMTCNPQWLEITAHLKPGQTAFEAPDLTARVFHQKHATFMKDMTERNIVGQVIAWIYVIEWQKRGLPHAHMLFTMAEEDKPDTPEKIDRVISASLPNVDDPMDPRYNIFIAVAKHNLHRKCGPGSPCWDPAKNICTKGFPKSFTDETVINDDGFPSYCRPNNGVRATVQVGNRTETYDNSSVVPYNPFVSVRFDCHCNWEVSCTIGACKYLYKYVYKGSDQASVRVEGEAVDEIKEHINGRYICPPEACHRIFGFPIQGKSHAVIHLLIHLPNMEPITFERDREAEALARERNTTLLAFFKLILEWRQKEAIGSDLGPVDPRTLYYHQLPEHFTFVKKDGIWKIKGRYTNNIGRVFTVSPKDPERYALRLLLFHKKDCGSYEELRTVNRMVEDSFASAARTMGLLQGERCLREAMEEAVIFSMPCSLRGFFATLINFAEATPAEAQAVWDDYKDDLAADYLRRIANPTIAYARAYYDVLDAVDSSVDFAGLIRPPMDQRPDEDDDHQYDHAREYQDRYAKLNAEQKIAVDSILDPQGTKLALLDGPGGSGKTFVYETIYHKLRAEGKKVLCLAWTGIAASLLPNGRTICSVFKMNTDDDCRTSYLKPNRKEGKFLMEFDTFIIDECSMLSHWMLETMERTLREVHNTADVFGGRRILMGGDFRQVLPIPPKHLRMDPVKMCLKESQLYRLFTIFPLTVNMRIRGPEQSWKEYLLRIGDGKEEEDEDGKVTLPAEIISNGNLIEEIFEGVYDDPDSLSKKAILCPKNTQVDKINGKVLDKMTADEKVFYSADSISKEGDDALHYPDEFINSLTPSSLPPHELHLKTGCVVMLLRNLAVKNGLCNGTRLQVTRFGMRHVLMCRFINGPRRGEEVLIPRVSLITNQGLSFSLKRHQFPVKLAFAMTINKSQGQSLQRVGVLLEEPVFGHGQLYVALSRGRTIEGVKVHIGNGSRKTVNIVDVSVL